MRSPVLFACVVLLAGALPSRSWAAFDHYEAAKTMAVYEFGYDEDRDFDREPDDWTRRVGPAFPHYVQVAIDRTRGANDTEESLRIKAGGGSAVLYSPPIPVTPLHTYVFEAMLRSEGLQADGGVITLSLLNARRERVRRLESAPVTGSTDGWNLVRFPTIAPAEDVRFLVIGCHLVAGERPDLSGSVWFDRLRLGRLPRMDLASNFHAHFVERDAPVVVNVRVSGMGAVRLPDPVALAETAVDGSTPSYEPEDTLELELWTRTGERVGEQQFRLQDLKEAQRQKHLREHGTEPPLGADDLIEVLWTLPPQDYGHYEVQATLRRKVGPGPGEVLLTQRTMLGVLDLIGHAELGDFGWSLGSRLRWPRLDELPSVMLQGGVNWVAVPVWQPVQDGHGVLARDLRLMLEASRDHEVEAIGMLLEPPAHLRAKFSASWTGIAELFEMPESFWKADLRPVLTRFATGVRYWQLGRDDSFSGRADLGEMGERIKKSLDTTGRNNRLMVPWKGKPYPRGDELRGSGRVLLYDSNELTNEEREEMYDAATRAKSPVATEITPLPVESGSLDQRTADLVQRMIFAKLRNVAPIMLSDVYDERTGLLNTDGSPRSLFLPFRTAALQLRGSHSLGEFLLPSGTRAAAFEKDGSGILALWNDTPIREHIPLGPAVETIDVWGHRQRPKLDAENRVQVDVGPVPIFIRGVSPGLVRFRLQLRFGLGRIVSAYGVHADRLIVQNPFPQSVAGSVLIVPPKGWDIGPREIPFELPRGGSVAVPVEVLVPSNVSLGEHPVHLQVNVHADRHYQIDRLFQYRIESPDLRLEVKTRWLDKTRLEVEQLLTNETDPPQTMQFVTALQIPGQRRQKQVIPKLTSGVDSRFYIIENADRLIGRELWLRVEQQNGRRVLNYWWKIEPPAE